MESITDSVLIITFTHYTGFKIKFTVEYFLHDSNKIFKKVRLRDTWELERLRCGFVPKSTKNETNSFVLIKRGKFLSTFWWQPIYITKKRHRDSCRLLFLPFTLLYKHEPNELLLCWRVCVRLVHANSINNPRPPPNLPPYPNSPRSIAYRNSINIIYHFILCHWMCLYVITLEWVFSTVRQFIFRFMLSFSAVPTILSFFFMNLYLCSFALHSFPPQCTACAHKRKQMKKKNGNWNWNFSLRYKKQWPSGSSLDSFVPCLRWYDAVMLLINLIFAEWDDDAKEAKWSKNCQTIQNIILPRCQNECDCISIFRMLVCIYAPLCMNV